MLLLAEDESGVVAGVGDGVLGGGVLVVAGIETEVNPSTDAPLGGGLEDAGGGEEVEEGGASEDEDDEPVLIVGGGGSVWLPEVWSPGVMVHCRTTCTRGSPFFPTTGVSVIMHVSVAIPEGVLIVCTVLAS